jgi:CHAD domain-containing protein
MLMPVEQDASKQMVEMIEGEKVYGVKIDLSDAINNAKKKIKQEVEADLGITFQDYISKYSDSRMRPTEEDESRFEWLNKFYKRFRFLYEKPYAQEKGPDVYSKELLKGVLYAIDYSDDYMVEVNGDTYTKN